MELKPQNTATALARQRYRHPEKRISIYGTFVEPLTGDMMGSRVPERNIG